MSHATAADRPEADEQLRERILDHLSVVRSMVPKSDVLLRHLIGMAILEARGTDDDELVEGAAPSM